MRAYIGRSTLVKVINWFFSQRLNVLLLVVVTLMFLRNLIWSSYLLLNCLMLLHERLSVVLLCLEDSVHLLLLIVIEQGVHIVLLGVDVLSLVEAVLGLAHHPLLLIGLRVI